MLAIFAVLLLLLAQRAVAQESDTDRARTDSHDTIGTNLISDSECSLPTSGTNIQPVKSMICLSRKFTHYARTTTDSHAKPRKYANSRYTCAFKPINDQSVVLPLTQVPNRSCLLLNRTVEGGKTWIG